MDKSTQLFKSSITNNSRVILDKKERQSLALFDNIVGLLQRGIEHIDAVDGNYTIAYFECALAVCRAARSYIGHNKRTGLELFLVETAAQCKTVRVVFFFQLYVNCLRSDRMMRMNSCSNKKSP